MNLNKFDKIRGKTWFFFIKKWNKNMLMPISKMRKIPKTFVPQQFSFPNMRGQMNNKFNAEMLIIIYKLIEFNRISDTIFQNKQTYYARVNGTDKIQHHKFPVR